jgi:hypothetical protein
MGVGGIHVVSLPEVTTGFRRARHAHRNFAAFTVIVRIVTPLPGVESFGNALSFRAISKAWDQLPTRFRGLLI